MKGDSLNSETRKKIFNSIMKFPGLYLNEIARKLNIPKSTVNYHLKYLQKKGLIVSHANSRYVRYYVTAKICKNDKKYLDLLLENVPCRIIVYLFLNPDSSQIEISKYLDKHPTTVSFHLDKLNNADVLETRVVGNKKQYKLKDAGTLLDLFVKYGDNFLNNGNELNMDLALDLLQKFYNLKN